MACYGHSKNNSHNSNNSSKNMNNDNSNHSNNRFDNSNNKNGDPKHQAGPDADLLEDVCCITQGRCWCLGFRVHTLNPKL